jgi:hypothetical protein
MNNDYVIILQKNYYEKINIICVVLLMYFCVFSKFSYHNSSFDINTSLLSYINYVH